MTCVLTCALYPVSLLFFCVSYACITSSLHYYFYLPENRCRRRDKFLLRGTERVIVTKPNGEDILSSSALCCEPVCFIGVSGLRQLQHILPGTVLEGKNK